MEKMTEDKPSKLLLMKTIGERAVLENNIPKGRILAINYLGNIIAEGKTVLQVLNQIQTLDVECFIWRAGYDYVERF